MWHEDFAKLLEPISEYLYLYFTAAIVHALFFKYVTFNMLLFCNNFKKNKSFPKFSESTSIHFSSWKNFLVTVLVDMSLLNYTKNPTPQVSSPQTPVQTQLLS